MGALRHSRQGLRTRSAGAMALAAALAAGVALPIATTAQPSAGLESRIEQALDAARAALAAEEASLDELARRNSHHALADGRPSSGQAVANVRLWDNEIRAQETKEGQLLERLRDELNRLRPDISSLARRLSRRAPAEPPTAAGAAPGSVPIAGTTAAELESRIEQALGAARAALVAEEARLDELARRNSRRALADGRPSSGQAAASIRLWNDAIGGQEAKEGQLLARLRDELDRLGPELSSLARRLSGSDSDKEVQDSTGEAGRPTEPEEIDQPLRRESGVLFRRVLSLPGAVMHPQPDASDTTQSSAIRTFSVFYVYEARAVNGATWLRVGQSIQRGAEGWIAARDTEEWRNMLVMQFPDRINRQRVLFFENEKSLRQLFSSFRRERDVAELYERLEGADTAGSIEGLVAVEPVESIAGDAQPYLMPILDWRPNVVIADTGDIATFVQVAGINAGDDTAPKATGEPALSELNLGIAFVIDTTRSMGPYIRAAREVIVQFAGEIEREGVGHFVDFALVGYRDSTSPNPGIEYVSRVYRDFGSTADLAELEEELGQARISPASTRDWREDAFAGLRTAIEELSWSPQMEARVIVLITDAGARSGNDPLSSHPRYDALNVLSDAQRRNIAIIPIHLLTPESERNDDITRARTQYQTIAATAEGSNYIDLAMGDAQVYRAEMQAMVANLRTVIDRLERDEAIEAVREDETLSESTRAVLDAFATDSSSAVEDGEPQPKPRLAALVQNQIFRAQLQYLGRERGTILPPFYRAWAADLDLANPLYQALDVRVFLTRNQLNELAEVLDLLLDDALRSGTSAQALMERLQYLSASMSVDPNLRTGAQGPGGTVASLLPGFLQELPYRSNIFDLSLRDFANASIQIETVEQLGYKLEQYRRINGDTAGWLDLGSGDPGEFVYPIQLRLLP